MTNKTFYTDYKTASHWGNCQLIMCNNIADIDPTVWNNMRFDYYDKDDNQVEIFQWFITDLTDWTVEWNEKTFDLKYTYSELLDKYILCVDHCGTSWDYVPCEVKSQSWIENNKDLKFKR
jgi:hypothetical protein